MTTDGATATDRDTTTNGGRHHLLTTWWLVGHVVVLAILVTFPQLAMWQWSRYREEQAIATMVEQRIDAAPRPLADVLDPSDGGALDPAEVAALDFTPVTVTGTWVADEQVAHRNRELNGRGGFDLLTPLSLGDGSAVLVRRGFVPPDGPASATPTVDVPTTGEVTVTGFLEASGRQPPGLGARDADTGVLTTVFHADVARLDRQTRDDLLPMLVHLVAQRPDDGPLPVPQPAPAHDTSQNLSYTVQWTIFTLIVGIGYAIVLRGRIRDHRAGVDSDVDPLLRDRVGQP